jgi:hypothetical protein
MMPCDDDPDKRAAAASHPIERRPPARNHLLQLCARAFCRIFWVEGLAGLAALHVMPRLEVKP